MDTEFDNENDDEMDETPQPDETPKALRRAAEEGKKAKAEAASLKRELAMLKAGVDIDSPIGKMFAKAYDGDATPEAIKAEWASISPSASATADTPEPEIPAEERQSTAERSALASNAPADTGTPPPDPRVVAAEKAQDARSKGASREHSMAEYFRTVVEAAQNGDERVIWSAR